MALFVKKFGKFMKKNSNPSFNKNNHKNDSNTNLKCFNCDRPRHFAADCWRPRKDDKKPVDKNNKEGRRSFRKNKEQKALLADDSKRKWADSDSDSSSSSDNEEEGVTCLMAVDESEVFDFSLEEFTKTDLINALDEMVIEYKKLFDSFNEINLKNTADCRHRLFAPHFIFK